jgi:hypothetical protein
MAHASKEEHFARKRKRNRRDYEKSKAGREHVLLRLDPGGMASLDAAAVQVGLSRAAFARLFLPALMSATGPRFAQIEAARGALGQSLAQFLARAIDDAVTNAAGAREPPPPAASEFDALFG